MSFTSTSTTISQRFVLALCTGALLFLGSLTSPLAANGQTTFVTSATAISSSLPQVQGYSADAFVDSMGVNTHLTYGNTPYYNNFPQVWTLLQQLGIRHIRDSYFNPAWGPPLAQRHQQLAESHIYTDYVMANTYNPGITPATIQQLKAEVNDMEMIEYPNECDNAGNCGSTQTTSLANMEAFAPMLNTAGVATGLPVLGPSMAQPGDTKLVPNMASLMTNNNVHAYFSGHNPGSAGWGSFDAQGHSYGSIPYLLDQANLDAPSVPVTFSETGYLSFAGDPQVGTIPPDVEESYLPRTYALDFMAGVKRTYIYEFLDEVNSPGYGIVDSTLTPKPAYLAIANLIANFNDPGTTPFTPGKLPYTVVGGGSTLKQLLLSKRDGSFWLVLWLEQSSYNATTMEYTPVTPQTIEVSVGGTYFIPNVGTFDTTGHLNFIGTWVPNYFCVKTIPLTVTDQMTLVKIIPN